MQCNDRPTYLSQSLCSTSHPKPLLEGPKTLQPSPQVVSPNNWTSPVGLVVVIFVVVGKIDWLSFRGPEIPKCALVVVCGIRIITGGSYSFSCRCYQYIQHFCRNSLVVAVFGEWRLGWDCSVRDRNGVVRGCDFDCQDSHT